MSEEGVSRRDFLRDIAVFWASSIVGVSGLELWANAEEPVDAEGTMAAFADTIIPGPTSDPEGTVGGVEAGALEVLYNPDYGLKPFIATLVTDLNGTSLKWYRKLFKDLDLAQRTEIVLFKYNNSPLKSIYELAGTLVKLAFYGAIINDVGTDYISFPGPSFGYHDYSFNEKLAEEATEDGSLP
jgi:hypothetical protein